MPKMSEGCPLFSTEMGITPKEINSCVNVVSSEVAYNGGDAQAIATIPAGSLILDVICNVTEAFDGDGATLNIGDSGDDADVDLFLASTDITPAQKGISRSSGTEAVAAKGYICATDIIVTATVTAGTSASKGKATVYVICAMSL